MPIDWLAVGAALLSGLLGGVHCVAMCGGVAAGVAVGAQPRDKREALRAAMLSNLGRVLGYTLAGLLVGGFGAGLIQLFRLDSLLFGMRMAVGLMLILIALRLMLPGRGGNLLGKPGIVLWQKIAPLQRHLLPANTATRQLALGMLWGWLPCGFEPQPADRSLADRKCDAGGLDDGGLRPRYAAIDVAAHLQRRTCSTLAQSSATHGAGPQPLSCWPVC